MPAETMSEKSSERDNGTRQTAATNELYSEMLARAAEEMRQAAEELQKADSEIRNLNGDIGRARQEAEMWRRRYLELFDNARDGYLATSLDGEILEANRAAAQMLGKTARSLRGRRIAAMVDASQASDYLDCVSKLQAGRSNLTIDIPLAGGADDEAQEARPRLTRARRTDAKVLWSLRAQPERQPAPQLRPAPLAPPAADVDAVIDRISEGYLAVDAQWRITSVNRALEQLVERPAAELRGQALWDAPPIAWDLSAHARLTNASRQQRPVQFRIERQDQKPPVDVRAYPSGSGTTLYFQEAPDQNWENAEEQSASRAQVYSESLQLDPQLDPSEGLKVQTCTIDDTDNRFGECFFDLVKSGPRQFGLIAGSIPGNKVEDLEFAAEVKHAFRALLWSNPRPGRALARLNDYICSRSLTLGMKDHGLVGMSVVVLNTRTGRAIFANAGGEPAILISRSGRMRITDVGGMAIGVQSGAVFEETEHYLTISDTLFICSGLRLTAPRSSQAGVVSWDAIIGEAIAADQTRNKSLGERIMTLACEKAGAVRGNACAMIVNRIAD